MGLELKDPPSSRKLTEEADITTGAHSRAASDGGILPQPRPSATEADPAVFREPSICPDPTRAPRCQLLTEDQNVDLLL